MNRYFVVFATIVVAVNARSARQGWGSSPPPASPGWPAPAPAPAPGWSAPPPANNIVASADGSLAAAGNGWVATSQDDELIGTTILSESTGGGGLTTNVSQNGVIVQTTLISPTDALAVQGIDVAQIAIGGQGIDTTVLGGDLAVANVDQWTAVSGAATSSAAGAVDVLVNKPS